MSRAGRFAIAARGVVVAGTMGVLMSGPAPAQSWTIQRSLESSVETNDNYGLSATRGDAVNTLSVSGAFGAARLTETAATRIDAARRGVTFRR